MQMTQITVALSPELVNFLERAADRDSRSVSGQVRHLVVQAARAAGARAEPSWPPVRQPPPLNTPEEVAAAKAHLAELERECDRLDRRQNSINFLPEHDERFRYLRDEVANLRRDLRVAGHMEK
jgi:hypothetical protein